MELKKRLGKRIQDLRKRNNLKQSELAEKIGIATKSQSYIETGKNYPTAENLEKYAKVFNVDVSEILNIGYIKPTNELLENMINMLKQANENEIKLFYKILTNIIN